MHLKQRCFFNMMAQPMNPITTEKEISIQEVVKDGEVYATVSNLLVFSGKKGAFLSLSFKEAVEQAIADKAFYIYSCLPEAR